MDNKQINEKLKDDPEIEEDEPEETKRVFSKTGTLVGVAAGAAVGVTACTVALPLVLGAAGFTSAGVAAGSLAAGIQTATTASGSLFAVCQSVGAAGLASSTIATTSGAFGAVGGLLFGSKSKKKATKAAADEDTKEDTQEK